MPRKTYYGAEARAKLKAGVDALADAVKTSLGPKGRNSVIWRGYGLPVVTKDGVSIAREVDPEDPAERMGAELVRQAAQKTNDASGDGTTTSTVLAQALVSEAFARLDADPSLDVHALRAEAERRVEEICAKLDAMAVPVAGDRERLRQVATLSANNDAALGQVIADVLADVGAEGVVTVDGSHVPGVSVDRVEGMRFARGFVSPYMMTDLERMVSELGDPLVVVTDYRVTTKDEIVALVKPAVDAGRKDVLLVAEAVEGDALSVIVANGPAFKKNFNVLAVTPPGYGDRRKEMMQDLCALTGATLISLETGKRLSDVSFDDYGGCAKVTSDVDSTTVVGGKGDLAAVEARIAQVRAALAKPELAPFDRDKLEERLAKLQGGVAVIRVGALTESEASERRYLVEDAVNAVKAAMREGIVPGGGMALWNAGAGEDVVGVACRAPFLMICANAGRKDAAPPAVGGYDAKNDALVPDMLSAGIVDPVSVTKSALRNACSAAMALVTTETVIVEILPEKE